MLSHSRWLGSGEGGAEHCGRVVSGSGLSVQQWCIDAMIADKQQDPFRPPSSMPAHATVSLKFQTAALKLNLLIRDI